MGGHRYTWSLREGGLSPEVTDALPSSEIRLFTSSQRASACKVISFTQASLRSGGGNGTVGAGGRGSLRPPGEKTKQGNNQRECLHEKLQLKSAPCTEQVSLRDAGTRHMNGAGNVQEQDLSLVDNGSGFGHFRVFFFFTPLWCSGSPPGVSPAPRAFCPEQASAHRARFWHAFFQMGCNLASPGKHSSQSGRAAWLTRLDSLSFSDLPRAALLRRRSAFEAQCFGDRTCTWIALAVDSQSGLGGGAARGPDCGSEGAVLSDSALVSPFHSPAPHWRASQCLDRLFLQCLLSPRRPAEGLQHQGHSSTVEAS